MTSIKDQQPEDSIRFLMRAEIFETLGATHLRIILKRVTIESYPTTGLLMECVHLQDDLRDLKTEFLDAQRQFKLNIKTLAWENPDTMALARQVCNCLQHENTITRMIQRIPCNEASSDVVLSEMQQKGMNA